MGCVNSKDQQPSGAQAKYVPPETVTTTTPATTVPSHQPVSQQHSQHRISVSSGPGSHNGSIGYNQSLPSVPSPVIEDEALFVARHAYQARTAEDLSFEKGEQLRVSLEGGREGWERGKKGGRDGRE